jgi:hypothetical protein
MDLLRPFVAETVGGRTAVCRRFGDHTAGHAMSLAGENLPIVVRDVYCCEEEKQNARIQQPSQRPPPLTTSPRLSLTTLPNNAPTTPIQIAIQPQAHDEHELLDFLLGSLRLEQEVDVTARLPLHTLGLALEDLDEGVSDNLALLLGALHTLQSAQELLAGAIRWELRPMLVWLWQRFSAEDMTSLAATTKPTLKTGR